MTKQNSGNTTSEFLPWDAVLTQDKAQSGGKGWNLALLHHFGFNVPNGGVVPVSVYQQFLQHNSLQNALYTEASKITLNNVLDHSSAHQLEQLRQQILTGWFPPLFTEQLQRVLQQQQLQHKALAVRSSASAEDSDSASFAGIHQSFLNVSGIDVVIDKIKQCYASLWTVQAVAYRRKMGFDDQQVLPAVVIMELVSADAAGVAFSCDPGTGREDIYVVSANFGLGESVVNGAEDVDCYFIENQGFTTQSQWTGKKTTKTVPSLLGGTETHTQTVAQQAVLNETQRSRLAMLVQRIHDAIGNTEQHQDIEWAMANDEFFILQARPVTRLPVLRPARFNQKSVWSNANYRDVIPMAQTLMQQHTLLAIINQTILMPLRLVGYPIPQGLSVNKLYQGRAYFNLSLYQWLLYDIFGTEPELVNLLAGGHQAEIEVPPGSPFKGKAGIKRILRILKNMRIMNKTTKNRQQAFDRCLSFCREVEQTQLLNLSDAELLLQLQRLRSLYMEYGPMYMILNANVGPLLMAINTLNRLFPQRGLSMANALMAGRGRITSADQGYKLLQLAAIAKDDPNALPFLSKQDFNQNHWQELPDHSPFKRAFAQYMQEYGHRGVYELDTTQARWREDPGYLLQNITSFLKVNLHDQKNKQQQTYDAALQQLKSKTGVVRRKFLLGLIDKGVVAAELREWAKSVFVHLCSTERLLLLECGRRFSQVGILEQSQDIFHTSPAEMYSLLLHHWDGNMLKALVQTRKVKWQKQQAQAAPDLIVDDEAQFTAAKPTEDGKSLQGIAVSSGVFQGKAVKLTKPDPSALLGNNSILIAPSTDPSWTPLFLKTGALALETGGYTSHGSIVAREYGIPAVVNVAGLLHWCEEGEELIVDGDLGRISK
ncbi:MAG: PEP-utilizing enzyme [Gammaproteobacteria bacterium]|nr:PEP-utilizing enzyme [Gammaproteobacteria bacterium]MDH5802011.1 PEP-utilizing enzyme [Gammaproteobacteria bacterium]